MDSKKIFKVGGEDKELFFSFAVQQRLFGNFTVDRFAEYMLDPNFSVRALGLLLLGKEFRTLETIDALLDRLDEFSLTDDEGHEIMMWVRERTLNFTEKEIEGVRKQVMELMPHLQNKVPALTSS